MQTNLDEFAEEYDKFSQESLKHTGAKREQYIDIKASLSKRLIDSPIKNILDFGCGDGLSSQAVSRNFPEANIFGVDISEKSIKLARKRFINNACFETIKEGRLPYEDNHFDLIFCSCVFHHIERGEWETNFRELYRVLKKGGKIHIFEHNPYNPGTVYVVSNCIFDEGVELIKPRELKDTLKELGFNITNIKHIIIFPRFMIFQRLLSLEKYLESWALGAQYCIEATKR